MSSERSEATPTPAPTPGAAATARPGIEKGLGPSLRRSLRIMAERVLRRGPVNGLISRDRLPIKRMLHIGANRGTKVASYAAAGIETWHVEAIPAVHEVLVKACEGLPGQHPILACLDEDVRPIEFNIASNNGEASSLLNLKSHAVLHPEVSVTEQISLTTTRLDDLVASGAGPSDVDALLLDVQGAELRVLKGGEGFLRSPRLKALVLEVAHSELYSGGVLFSDLSDHLRELGFYLKRVEFDEVGSADAVYLKRWWPEGDGETPPLYQ